MLTPLDEYVQQWPKQAKPPEIYVDDGTITIVERAGTVAKIATEAALGPVGHCACPPPRRVVPVLVMRY